MNRHQRLFWRKYSDTIRWTFFVILMIVGMFILWKTQEPRLKEHNKYQCAVYGYEEDCKTPLPPERRLK